jgi:hypothetical protein
MAVGYPVDLIDIYSDLRLSPSSVLSWVLFGRAGGAGGDVPKNIVECPPKVENITPVLVLQVAKKNARGARRI